MHKEIGSDFWINKNIDLEMNDLNLNFLNINKKECHFLSSGRKAIEFVLKNINILSGKKIALLPAFTCYSVIEPFIRNDYNIYYYNIGKDLYYSKENFLEDVLKYKPNVVLLHAYFGFDTLKYIKNDIKRFKYDGIIFIEDLTQIMYSDFEHTLSDYYIASFRKWTALPDGSFAVSSCKDFKIEFPIKSDDALEKLKMKAFHEKYLYIEDKIKNKDKFLTMFREAEEILANQKKIFSMSNMSKKIQSNLSINTLKIKRKKNFRILFDAIKNIGNIESVFYNISEEITPLYFPIYVKKDRERFQKYLSEKNIYAPIVWPKSNYCKDKISEEVDWIYSHILCLPCDQRYDYEDMCRIIDVVISYNTNLKSK